jgi:predicted GNAT superfamily acetyltransferase
MADIRALTAHEEFREAVRLQRAIWGFEDVDVAPARLFVVATRIGGQALGAFEGPRMVGFCMAIPAIQRSGRAYLHSHMLGVLEDFRNRGIGRALKLAQRDDAVARGIDLIEWTFDPLQLKNAFFNIERLGAIVRRYVHNQYGTTSSPLHGGLPTDRCVAEWWLRSPRAEAILGGRERGGPAVERCVRVPVSMNDPRAIQSATADALEQGFRDGLAVIGFERTDEAGTYLLGTWTSE